MADPGSEAPTRGDRQVLARGIIYERQPFHASVRFLAHCSPDSGASQCLTQEVRVIR